MTIEDVVAKIKRYRTRTEFMANCKNDYAWLKANNLERVLDELRPRLNAQSDVVTLDYILDRARRCSSQSQFQQNYYKLYVWAKERGLLSEIEKVLPTVPHEERIRRAVLNRAFTDQELVDDAKKYPTRLAWRQAGIAERQAGDYSHYGAALHRGLAFMNTCCAHMPNERGKHPSYQISDADLLASARRFETRGAWKDADRNAYQAAQRRPIWDECVAHMRPAANPFAKDYVLYAYEFSDGYCYVGLTCVPANRKATHFCRGPVFMHGQETGLTPVFKELETGLTHLQAVAGEDKWQAAYKDQGWTALHTAKAGSLGGIHGSKWTKEAVIAQARKYMTKQEWIDHSQFTYRLAKKMGWFDEASAHMPKRVLGIGLGLKRSAETRQKLALAAQARTADPAWRAAHSAKLAGRSLSQAHRDAIRRGMA